SALFLLLNFVCLAFFYVLLYAQFLAAAQIIVYAGAIVVMFLFVTMLVGWQTSDVIARSRPYARYASVLLGLLLLALLGYGLLLGTGTNGPIGAPEAGSAAAVGQALFTRFLLPFELASVLLLAAIVGAIALARRRV
ncbi:MAG TPA: NADH-quinone oxidoreductase subunit J, partial [Anaerolineae bacterium]|nr:NADH-quinone oxidoreductase subunit J [Anaerolineae bacterium]